MSAAKDYAAWQDAVAAQNRRIFGPQPPIDPWGGRMAQLFRLDPLRDLDDSLKAVASYLRPDDVFVDVGGGAGRVGLPMARRCREVIVVEPSPGMGAEFDASCEEACIGNADRVQADWMDTRDVSGDVVFAGCVTYFVRDIVAFVEKLAAAASRRVMITLWSEPPPCSAGPLFQMVYGEEQKPLPGFRQLLAVLWDMDILPDVIVLPDSPWWENGSHPSREDALQWALDSPWLRPEDRERAAGVFQDNLDELFIPGPHGYRPGWQRSLREMLITWEPS
ncbi:MAG: methyltransferase domain-containing protein [Dehalococcoidia bacterium]|nr:methyltransferase domain-containing protein [Dehalococcoidia bacterium]